MVVSTSSSDATKQFTAEEERYVLSLNGEDADRAEGCICASSVSMS